MFDALNKKYEHLTRGEDPVFVNCASPYITLRIEVGFISKHLSRYYHLSLIYSGQAISPGLRRLKLGVGVRVQSQ